MKMHVYCSCLMLSCANLFFDLNENMIFQRYKAKTGIMILMQSKGHTFNVSNCAMIWDCRTIYGFS